MTGKPGRARFWQAGPQLAELVAEPTLMKLVGHPHQQGQPPVCGVWRACVGPAVVCPTQPQLLRCKHHCEEHGT